MSQNTSSAVMNQRIEPHDSLDFFPTPAWGTRALFEHCIELRPHDSVWEPACGCGAMSRVVEEYAKVVIASDVHDYRWGHMLHDFLMPFLPALDADPDWIITNPPFRLAEEFALRALKVARTGVALLVRTTFLASIGRYQRLFRPRHPVMIWQFTERLPMVKGRLEQDASTATDYCWVIWQTGHSPRTRFGWIPPCRSTLERPEDWPAIKLTEPAQ